MALGKHLKIEASCQGKDAREEGSKVQPFLGLFNKAYITTSPGWMHETSAQAWCTGKTQRNLVEMEVGGGIGMGNKCKSMAESCQSKKKKTLQYCKVISLQLIKINLKNKAYNKKK